MKIFIQLIGLACCVLAFTGCEWTAGSGVDSWDSNYAGSDFSGSYRASDNGILVRSFTSSNSVTTTSATNTVSDEHLATGTGTNTAFNGQTGHMPVRGSLTIFTIGGYRFTDTVGTTADTVTLAVTPADGSAGTFNYSTHAWALTFPAPLASGTEILGTYQYGSSTSTTNSSQGNHGSAIYSFVVYQTGNRLQITDSNGAMYEGLLGNVSGTTTNTSTGISQFSATGVSQGYNVTLVGVLAGNSMRATYIEEGGNEADINAIR